MAQELAIRYKFAQNSSMSDTWNCFFDKKNLEYFTIAAVAFHASLIDLANQDGCVHGNCVEQWHTLALQRCGEHAAHANDRVRDHKYNAITIMLCIAYSKQCYVVH